MAQQAICKIQMFALAVCCILSASFLHCNARRVGFYYFVLEWPGSYCDTWSRCCYPKTGKPAADFSIHGLWPDYNNGGWPSYCDQRNRFDPSLITDLEEDLTTYWSSLSCPSSNSHSFWAHEWNKHGTCTESTLDQHAYFQAAIRLRERIDLLGALQSAGIHPDGGRYSLRSIVHALEQAIGHTPAVECNRDAYGNTQLYEVYICVATDGSTLIPCSVFPQSSCSSYVVFPSFGHTGVQSALSS
ncbi:hypothetical protein O6H91_08G071100 [Diphasiastrum complanatum]|uniref:Uncharacterized protein n=2 Tax=Diphasiastrum complanatum TaxID=34168 RepID=A0ACC2CYT8_DIPCM|nr:hypothetical protein O6H91_08G071000 [Diphasiastrum complanatum]KAJ7547135.1 hypothetical protein O6H91_08G071100 [Diphasiastrum complanatum]